MQKVKMTATTNLRYDKRSLAVGDEFDATPKDAKLLTVLGKATKSASKYQTRVMTAATEAAPPVAAAATPKKVEPLPTKVAAQTFKTT